MNMWTSRRRCEKYKVCKRNQEIKKISKHEGETVYFKEDLWGNWQTLIDIYDFLDLLLPCWFVCFFCHVSELFRWNSNRLHVGRALCILVHVSIFTWHMHRNDTWIFAINYKRSTFRKLSLSRCQPLPGKSLWEWWDMHWRRSCRRLHMQMQRGVQWGELRRWGSFRICN